MNFDPTKYTKSRWIKGSDLGGQAIAVTIANVFEHRFEQQNEVKPALEFSDHDQQLVMNKTQVTTMIELFGTDPRAWMGQRITLTPAASNYQGRPTIAITATTAPMPTINGQAGNVAVSREDVQANALTYHSDMPF